MTPDFMGDLVVGLVLMLGFLAILAVGGLVADYILPHIKPLERWLETLPLWEDDEGED